MPKKALVNDSDSGTFSSGTKASIVAREEPSFGGGRAKEEKKGGISILADCSPTEEKPIGGPQSMIFGNMQPRQYGYSSKKSTISIVESEKRRHESVITSRAESVFDPDCIVEEDEDTLNEVSKSIVFPNHTLQRINEDAAEINNTLQVIQQNRAAERQRESSVIDFGPSESQFPGDSSFVPPKIIPALSPRFMQQLSLPRRSKQLFEDFLVIGATPEELSKEEGKTGLDPAILWRFRKEEDSTSSSYAFCFTTWVE